MRCSSWRTGVAVRHACAVCVGAVACVRAVTRVPRLRVAFRVGALDGGSLSNGLNMVTPEARVDTGGAVAAARTACKVTPARRLTTNLRKALS